MNTVVDAECLTDMSVEWERNELLAYCLGEERMGRKLSDELLERLKQLQMLVRKLRSQGVEGPWGRLGGKALQDLEYDLLSLVMVPEIEPRIGWLFQNLQPGNPQPYPTPALIQELLALRAHEAQRLYAALHEQAPLRRFGLIQTDTVDPFQPLRPGPGVVASLLGRPLVELAPPGSTRVSTRAHWDDLVLPSDRMAMLREFLFWIQHRRTVIDEWGGEAAGGPIALFTGPSGTGKTFAAAVLANELGWPLYRVDLGALVSKYIGETEKNLNRLFGAAHGRPMVLQYDEADSLFSKRGEVKEARDRYANMEVSHLLARIETHEGPVILTTNLRHQLDPSFTRRFQMVVDFPRPDAAARAQLWQRALPSNAPRTAEVDPDFLGNAINLTGGSIRNAALHAAYLAAGRSQDIDLSLVTLAVWRELGKDGRKLTPTDLGPLASWLPKEEHC